MAAIERRGNKIVGVEPRVVTIVDHVEAPPPPPPPPAPRFDDEALVQRVRNSPRLLAEILAWVVADASDGKVIDYPIMTAVTALEHLQPWATRRSVEQWAGLLEELRKDLVRGAIYDRDLKKLATALNPVLDAFDRRARRR